MLKEINPKITNNHLNRKGYLYIRQSTPEQVYENRESLERQYSFKKRALSLGWRDDQIEIIDSDLGQSGSSASERKGFQRLMTNVSLGKVGLVMALEVSRLARKCSDWYRLVEYCILTQTLLLDEDGLYDPASFNDKIILGMKGTMSEIELHMLQARMKGGLLNKARRGELKKPLPVGFVYDDVGKICLDPDLRVQEAIQLFFDTYRRIGTVYGTVHYFCEKDILFPHRKLNGPRNQPVSWGKLTFIIARRILGNLHYAGVYSYGRKRIRKTPDGKHIVESVPRGEWTAFIKDAHKGYITYEEYEINQNQLAKNNTRQGQSVPREGNALIQGIAICGRCGKHFTVNYHKYSKKLVPSYNCYQTDPSGKRIACQSITGTAIDKAISNLVVEAVTPLALEVSLAVQEKLEAEAAEVDRLRYQQVERAKYEAELAKRRYMKVDPDNRLVASSLETDWNEKLKALSDAENNYEKQCQADRFKLDQKKRSEILSLASDFPKLWNAPSTPMRERKRILRLLIEDITLLKKKDVIDIHVRFRGGATRSLTVPVPLKFGQTNVTPPEVVKEIDLLLNSHCEDEIAKILNKRGLKSGCGQTFNNTIVTCIRQRYGLKSYFERLREQGLLTSNELAEQLNIKPDTVRRWRRKGLLQGIKCVSSGRYAYKPPNEELIARLQKAKKKINFNV